MQMSAMDGAEYCVVNEPYFVYKAYCFSIQPEITRDGYFRLPVEDGSRRGSELVNNFTNGRISL